MSLTPFAALEARVNDAVQRNLANATAVYQAGLPFGVVLDRSRAESFGGAVDAAGLTVSYCLANTPGISEGSELEVGGVVHIVTGPVQPDAGGWITLSIYPKA